MDNRNYIDLPYGITTIDTGYCPPGFDASHWLVEKGQVALVDVETTFSVPRLMRVLEDKGIAYEVVRYMMAAYAHLDHPGGAGALLHNLPNAQRVIYPRGAPHIIDPAKLFAGATAVHGEKRIRASG